MTISPPTASRSSGLLLHVTSLPSDTGVGDLGPVARGFVERLADAGQRIWQVLPLNPTDPAAGESPYFTSSSLAGNPLLISLDDLRELGLLEPHELPSAEQAGPGEADFALARAVKEPPITLAAQRVVAADDSEFLRYCAAESHWLDDHALFTVLAKIHGSEWADWAHGLKYHEDDAIHHATLEFRRAIDTEKARQFLFARQWSALREYAAARSVALFGDLPIYVNTHSVDVWRAPWVFQLDEDLKPRLHSGVPPDYFSATGQLWRNPVYDWEALQRHDFDWWVRRLQTVLSRFDLLRIDHFRGLVQYWAVDAGAETAIDGSWLSVPADDLFAALQQRIHPLPVVAEDLGTITPDVIALRERLGFPGMAVLQFAFGDDHGDNPHKLCNHRTDTVAYLATHDNNTTAAWLDHELDEHGWHRLRAEIGDVGGTDAVYALIHRLLGSRANTVILTAQDLLALPASARMNTPGLENGNWRWQLTREQFDALPPDWLRQACAEAGRCA